MKTKNGFEIIKSEALYRGSNLVMVKRVHHHSPYVVWIMNSEGDTCHGSYCTNKEEADNAFRKRLKDERD
jgi:hypothetical protein